MNLLDLPDEILDEIVGHLIQWHPRLSTEEADKKRRKDMSAVCLTSKRMLPFGRKALYRYPILTVDDTYETYEAATLDVWQRLQRILQLPSTSIARYLYVFYCPASRLVPLPSSLVNVRQLFISLEEEETPKQSALCYSSLCFSIAKLMHLLLIRLTFSTSGIHLSRSLAICPIDYQGELQLQFLSSSRSSPQLDEAVIGWHRLTRLTFLQCDFTPEIVKEVARHTRSDALSWSDYYLCHWEDTLLRGDTKNWCQSIKHLTIDELDFSPVPLHVVQQFQQLESLTVTWLSYKSATADNFLKYAPPTLRILRIAQPTASTISILCDTLPRFPQLQLIAVQIIASDWRGLSHNKIEDALVTAMQVDKYCNEKSIQTWPASLADGLLLWIKDRKVSQYWSDWRYALLCEKWDAE